MLRLRLGNELAPTSEQVNFLTQQKQDASSRYGTNKIKYE